MPVTILSESDATLDAGSVSFVSEDTGDLKLESSALIEFLQHLDFSSLFQVEGIEDLVINAKQAVLDEDGTATDETEEIQILPGAVALSLIDHEDLVASLDAYAEMLSEAASEGTLEEKTRAAALLDALGFEAEDIEEAKKKNPFKPPYKKGTFKKLHKRGGAMKNRAVRSMIAMLKKGVIKRTKDGGYTKDKGYRKGGTPAGKKAYSMYTGKNKAKIKKAAKGALSASDMGLDVTSLSALAEAPEWGFGIPFQQALFTVAVSEDAGEVVERFKGKMKGKKGMAGFKAMMKKGKKGDEEEEVEETETATETAAKKPSLTIDGEDGDEATNESTTPQPRSMLHEGVRLAGAIGRTMQGRSIAAKDETQD